MASNKAATAAAATSTSNQTQPAAVCCMCGDHGLLPELFRCTACSFRSQHTYCTDRYPKAESYSICNWCLRADQGVSSLAKSNIKEHVRPVAHDVNLIGGDSGGVSARMVPKVARGDHFVSHQNKPIKKQRFLRRSASDVGSHGRAKEEAPPSPGVTRGRPRVRRYKLLEEVITN